jgi:predicted Zn finger-like uncharacterized protein
MATIITCEKCRTRFHFDESTIPPGGAWFRCGRCQHVFFDKPSRTPAAASQGIQEGQLGELPSSGRAIPSQKTADREEQPEQLAGVVSRASKVRRQIWKALLLLLIICMVAGGFTAAWYFSANPATARMVVESLRSVPLVRSIVGHFISEESGPAYVKLTQMRQRYVGNWLVGNVRVLEGQAVNMSRYPMTRIQIRAELLDGGGDILAAQTAYSGNLLTDSELASLSDMEMQKKLAIPQGSTVSNDRIESGAEIPFMIVFANEPLGVTRTVCMPVAAERLLP